MSETLLLNSTIYAWLVIPSLIFVARIADVSMGTVRVIFISRGMKYLAPVVGFFEILIWLLAIGQIMKNLSNPVCYIAYAGGFATGNYVGILIAERLSLGIVMLRVVTRKQADELVSSLRSANYGVTSVNGEGANGKVKIVFTVVPRKQVAEVVEMVKRCNPKAFYTIEEVGFVEKGVIPIRKKWWSRYSFENLVRPFKKGK
ncbi:MAG TPA: DUF2179 domain-containing protein [Planctomycetes bacterium]|nr:DUF2179 domain-containing protein [Planctomycetota bacterium]